MEPRQGTCVRCPARRAPLRLPQGSPRAPGARSSLARSGCLSVPWAGPAGPGPAEAERRSPLYWEGGDKGSGIYTVRGSRANFLCQTLPISISLETSLGSAKNFSDYLKALFRHGKISDLPCSEGEKGTAAKAKFWI